MRIHHRILIIVALTLFVKFSLSAWGHHPLLSWIGNLPGDFVFYNTNEGDTAVIQSAIFIPIVSSSLIIYVVCFLFSFWDIDVLNKIQLPGDLYFRYFKMPVTSLVILNSTNILATWFQLGTFISIFQFFFG